jgi:hypothetical protein
MKKSYLKNPVANVDQVTRPITAIDHQKKLIPQSCYFEGFHKPVCRTKPTVVKIVLSEKHTVLALL